jgi:tetratricopeptide (TPR) repeat protein
LYVHRYKSIADYTNAIKNDKQGDIFLYNNRADCYLANGEYQKAIKDYSRALLAEDNRYQLYFARANAEWKLGLKGPAIADCKRAKKDDPIVANDKDFQQLCKQLGIK